MKILAENNVAAYYDAEANRFLQKAASWANLSDNKDFSQRGKYSAEAAMYFRKAGEALDLARQNTCEKCDEV